MHVFRHKTKLNLIFPCPGFLGNMDGFHPSANCEWVEGKRVYTNHKISKWNTKTKNWEKANKEFILEEIPDLPKDFTDEQFKEYGLKYGVWVAGCFLQCADICKYTHAYNRIYPDPNGPTKEESKLFFDTFGVDVKRFHCSIFWAFGKWGFDVIRFDEFLKKEFSYDETNKSISAFLLEKWGKGVQELIKRLISKD